MFLGENFNENNLNNNFKVIFLWIIIWLKAEILRQWVKSYKISIFLNFKTEGYSKVCCFPLFMTIELMIGLWEDLMKSCIHFKDCFLFSLSLCVVFCLFIIIPFSLVIHPKKVEKHFSKTKVKVLINEFPSKET